MRSYFLLALLGQLSACNIVLGVDDPTPRPEPAPDGGAGAGTQEEPECTTNAQCLGDTAEFDPYACVNGHCIELLTDECPLLLPQTDRGWLESLRSTNVPPIIFGAFTDMESSSIYSARARNFDLAFTEIMRAAGGIPAPGGKKRAILALACQNQYANPEDFDRAIDHLIEEVQVPGILPVLETHNLLHAFERSGASHHVLFMSPSGAENALLDNMNYGLVWTMLPGGAALAPTYAPLLDLTVEHLRNTGALGKNEPVRVALVRADDYASMNEMASAITDEIRFNGKSANDNAPYYFQSFSVSSSVLASSPPDYTAAAKALVDFAPHVVISRHGRTPRRLHADARVRACGPSADLPALAPQLLPQVTLEQRHALRSDGYELPRRSDPSARRQLRGRRGLDDLRRLPSALRCSLFWVPPGQRQGELLRRRLLPHLFGGCRLGLAAQG